MQQPTTDAASIALLRSLRAGEGIHFVHRADVCSAAPEELVAGLQPVPGTEGYSRVWYFFCAKKFKNTTGKASGYRQRAIVGGDTCWRAELRPKRVDGSDDGATFCNLSYGRKTNGSGRTFDRMGWCMVEYDDDSKNGDGGDNNNVLCKIYRSSSSLAKGKSKSSTSTFSASSTGTTTSSSTSKSKRKAATATTDHPDDARAAKFAHHEQYNTAELSHSQYVDHFAMQQIGDGNRHGVQQHAHLEAAPVVTHQDTVDDEMMMYGGTMPTESSAPPDDDLFAGIDPEQLLGDTAQPGPELLVPMPPPDANFFDGVEHLFVVGAHQPKQGRSQRWSWWDSSPPHRW